MRPGPELREGRAFHHTQGAVAKADSDRPGVARFVNFFESKAWVAGIFPEKKVG